MFEIKLGDPSCLKTEVRSEQGHSPHKRKTGSKNLTHKKLMKQLGLMMVLRMYTMEMELVNEMLKDEDCLSFAVHKVVCGKHIFRKEAKEIT